MQFLKSFFVDPAASGKGSMTRLCEFILVLATACAIISGHDVTSATSAIAAVAMSVTRTKASQ